MVDPTDKVSLDNFLATAGDFAGQLGRLIAKRLKRARRIEKKQWNSVPMEITAQFVHFRALAESLEEEVVTEGNQEFLRAVIDNLKQKFEEQ